MLKTANPWVWCLSSVLYKDEAADRPPALQNFPSRTFIEMTVISPKIKFSKQDRVTGACTLVIRKRG